MDDPLLVACAQERQDERYELDVPDWVERQRRCGGWGGSKHQAGICALCEGGRRKRRVGCSTSIANGSPVFTCTASMMARLSSSSLPSPSGV